MKRINEYKKLFGVENDLDLKTLKSTYRGLIKEWHPDKFQEGDALALEAEVMSQKIIDAYHFLVGISPATKEANLEEYSATINESGILDFKHKGLLLEITFVGGVTYEYYGVPRNVYMKFVNSDKQVRFAKRSIYNSYMYRKSKNSAQVA